MENEESRKGRRGVIAALVLCVSVALPAAAAEPCDLTLEIRPAASDAIFRGLVVRSSDPPAGPIELEPGESVEGYVATLARSGDCPEDLRIEWQYETTMAVGDEGPHLDLDDWLHFTSEWREGDPVPGGGVPLPQLAAEKALPFPAFHPRRARRGRAPGRWRTVGAARLDRGGGRIFRLHRCERVPAPRRGRLGLAGPAPPGGAPPAAGLLSRSAQAGLWAADHAAAAAVD
jgi:hypothetical protein